MVRRMITSSNRTALALGQLAMLFVGSSVAAASLLSDYPVLTGQAARYAVAAAGLWAWTRLRGRRLPRLTPRDAGWLFGVAVAGLSGFNVVLIEATARIGPSVVGAVLGGTPIALAVLGPLQARRPISARTVACALVVSAGVLLVERASAPSTRWGSPSPCSSSLGRSGSPSSPCARCGASDRLACPSTPFGWRRCSSR